MSTTIGLVFDTSRCIVDVVYEISTTPIIFDPEIPDPPPLMKECDPVSPPQFPTARPPSVCTIMSVGTVTFNTVTGSPTFSVSFTENPAVECGYEFNADIGFPCTEVSIGSATITDTGGGAPFINMSVDSAEDGCEKTINVEIGVPAGCTPDLLVRSQWIVTTDCDAPPWINFVIEPHPTIPCRYYLDMQLKIPVCEAPELLVRSQYFHTTDCNSPPYINFVVEQHPTVPTRFYFDLQLIFPSCATGTTSCCPVELFIRSQSIQTTDCSAPPSIDFLVEPHPTIPNKFYFDLHLKVHGCSGSGTTESPGISTTINILTDLVCASGNCLIASWAQIALPPGTSVLSSGFYDLCCLSGTTAPPSGTTPLPGTTPSSTTGLPPPGTGFISLPQAQGLTPTNEQEIPIIFNEFPGELGEIPIPPYGENRIITLANTTAFELQVITFDYRGLLTDHGVLRANSTKLIDTPDNSLIYLRLQDGRLIADNIVAQGNTLFRITF